VQKKANNLAEIISILLFGRCLTSPTGAHITSPTTCYDSIVVRRWFENGSSDNWLQLITIDNLSPSCHFPRLQLQRWWWWWGGRPRTAGRSGCPLAAFTHHSHTPRWHEIQQPAAPIPLGGESGCPRPRRLGTPSPRRGGPTTRTTTNAGLLGGVRPRRLRH
jgi:hypothetical protein